MTPLNPNMNFKAFSKLSSTNVKALQQLQAAEVFAQIEAGKLSSFAWAVFVGDGILATRGHNLREANAPNADAMEGTAYVYNKPAFLYILAPIKN